MNPEGFLLRARIKQEVPIVVSGGGGRGRGDYTLGMVDAIIETDLYRVKTVTKTIDLTGSDGFADIQDCEIEAGEKYREILMCEIKPRLKGHLGGMKSKR